MHGRFPSWLFPSLCTRLCSCAPYFFKKATCILSPKSSKSTSSTRGPLKITWPFRSVWWVPLLFPSVHQASSKTCNKRCLRLRNSFGSKVPHLRQLRQLRQLRAFGSWDIRFMQHWMSYFVVSLAWYQGSRIQALSPCINSKSQESAPFQFQRFQFQSHCKNNAEWCTKRWNCDPNTFIESVIVAMMRCVISPRFWIDWHLTSNFPIGLWPPDWAALSNVFWHDFVAPNFHEGIDIEIQLHWPICEVLNFPCLYLLVLPPISSGLQRNVKYDKGLCFFGAFLDEHISLPCLACEYWWNGSMSSKTNRKFTNHCTLELHLTQQSF